MKAGWWPGQDELSLDNLLELLGASRGQMEAMKRQFTEEGGLRE